MKRALIDVDGVILDLIGGFCKWMKSTSGVEMNRDSFKTHGIEEPLRSVFAEFVRKKDCYSNWVPMHKDAVEGIQQVYDMGYEIVINTATMVEAPDAYGTKLNRLIEILPVPFVFLCVPGSRKHYVKGTVGIDDRADVCLNYYSEGIRTILVEQPWSYKSVNQALDCADTIDIVCDYDYQGRSAWKQIVRLLDE